jgi:hypothetical protein
MADFVTISELRHGGRNVIFHDPTSDNTFTLTQDQAAQLLEESFFGESVENPTLDPWLPSENDNEVIFLGDGKTWFWEISRKPNDSVGFIDAMGKRRGAPKLNWAACFGALSNFGLVGFESHLLEGTSYKRLVETLPETGAEIIEDIKGGEFHEVLVSLQS